VSGTEDISLPIKTEVHKIKKPTIGELCDPVRNPPIAIGAETFPPKSGMLYSIDLLLIVNKKAHHR